MGKASSAKRNPLTTPTNERTTHNNSSYKRNLIKNPRATGSDRPSELCSDSLHAVPGFECADDSILPYNSNGTESHVDMLGPCRAKWGSGGSNRSTTIIDECLHDFFRQVWSDGRPQSLLKQSLTPHYVRVQLPLLRGRSRRASYRHRFTTKLFRAAISRAQQTMPIVRHLGEMFPCMPARCRTRTQSLHQTETTSAREILNELHL